MQKIKKYIFPALYIIGFLGAFIIGFFGNSFFAYDKFNSLWADICYLLFISMLYITAFVQEVCASHTIANIAVNSAVFIAGLIFLLLYFIFGGVLTLCMLIFSAIMAVVVICRYILVLRKDYTAKPDFKQIIAVLALWLFAMIEQMHVDYVSDKLWLWALIPAAVLTPVVAVLVFLPLKKVWKNIYPTERKSVFNAIVLVILLFGAAYIFSANFIGISNEVFDGEPQKVEYTVIDKKVRSGARTPTQFEVKVIIDGKERWIPVYVTDYHEVEEGDLIILDYYSGAFKLAYYSYYGKA